MKFFASITLSLITSASLFAQTTMCFKENHASMLTIESTPLDGGACASTKSINEMKNEGWSIEDIKIESAKNGKNYIYILKKDSGTISTLDEEKLEEKILQKLENRKKQELATKKKEIKIRMSKDGKRLYINKCQNCHGEKADKIYGPSRALTKLNLFDFKTAIRDYNLGEYDRGQAFIMAPYANLMDSQDIKNVYSYIQSLKNEKMKKEDRSEEESK